MKQLIPWITETNKLVDIFSKKYFGRNAEVWWIAGDVGGVLHVNDYFFNLDRIIDALRFKATRKQLFDYYDLELTSYPHPEINFKNYIKHGVS